MDADALLEISAREYGEGCAGSTEPWIDALRRFMDDYNRSELTSEAGRAATFAAVKDMVSTRLKIEAWAADNPVAMEQPVDRPLFIMGMPRAGTTLLMNLLRHDKGRRVYWHWEANRELPPARTETLASDDRIALKVQEIEAGLASGALDPRHHLERGDEPTECFWPLSRDFKSYVWMVQTQVPAYSQWLIHDADMIPAYRHHKQTLQLMQSSAPGRWTLKYPSHALAIDALLTVYPDARILFCHRDPIKPVASTCNMVRHILKHNMAGCDPALLGRETLDLISASADRMIRARDDHPDVPFFDLRYKSFVADPMGFIHDLYGFLGEHLPADAEARMLAELARNERERAQSGAHHYDMREFGLSEGALRVRFKEYCDRFDVQMEGN